MSDRPAEAAHADHLRERLLVRGLAALAALTWPSAATLIATQSTRATTLSPLAFSLTASWLVGLGCLAFGTCMMRHDDPHIVRVLTCGLPLGDPRLDDVLVPETPRWRTRFAVRRALGCAAACTWILAAIYTGQAADGVYQVPLLITLFTLILFLAAGIWTTVILLAGTCDVRRETAYALACEAHALQRAERDRLTALADHHPHGTPPIDSGGPSESEQPGLHVVREHDSPPQRGPQGAPTQLRLLAAASDGKP